ncbi:MAG: hybrid sensor histidine kinase/response regulator [Verrucomicrobia bacterium]|nr:hybrid sensor histidine kinase/response regulator [Verrucomicrobiota bacterium]
MTTIPPATLPPPHESLILIVDDVQQNIQVVGTMLREAGYSIMPATSGAAALQRVQKKLPDLILLDLMMPELDGLEVCRRLKAEASTQNIPVIFLTASNEMSHLVQGLQAGAVDYVTKPFNPPELLARVRTHLELKHSRDMIVRYSQQLAHLNNEKNEFMGIVAHDLRSPLGAIKGFAELILEEGQIPREELEDFTRRIRDTAQRMAEMVQNLLDANRIERGEMKVSLAPCELSQLLRAVVQSYQPRAAAKQQSILLDDSAGPATVMADRNVTVQVLENLVSNAIKYSPSGKNIYARLRVVEGAARCEVQDEGPGLSAEDQQKLFGKFARLSAKPTGGEHATGLGLSIVKRLVEAMNGRVWCESEPGRGATFIVELPAA